MLLPGELVEDDLLVGRSPVEAGVCFVSRRSYGRPNPEGSAANGSLLAFATAITPSALYGIIRNTL